MKFTLTLLATIVGLSNAVKLESKHYGGFAMNIGHDDDDYLAQSKTSARYDFEDLDHPNPDYFAQSKTKDDEEMTDEEWLAYLCEYYGEAYCHLGVNHDDDYLAQSKTKDDEEMTDEEWLAFLCDYYGEDYCYE